ncbi:MAG: hypothetical protein M0R80_13295 [Proteobacteria bacterium]|jgi:hypothetical protein|nr:hypothetical protein [Pseudomonadota bacterium]
MIELKKYLHVDMLSEEELYRLTSLLREHNESAMKPLILHHIPLTAHFAGQTTLQFGYRSGECLSAGLEGLVASINRIYEAAGTDTPILRDNNITPYLVVCIKGAILDFVNHDHLVPIGRATVRKGLKDFPRLTPITILPSGFETDIDHLLEHRDFVESDLQGTYIEMGLNERDIKVLQLKLMGYTYQEISDLTGYTFPLVSKIFRGIQDKFIMLFKFRPRHARKRRSDREEIT